MTNNSASGRLLSSELHVCCDQDGVRVCDPGDFGGGDWDSLLAGGGECEAAVPGGGARDCAVGRARGGDPDHGVGTGECAGGSELHLPVEPRVEPGSAGAVSGASGAVFGAERRSCLIGRKYTFLITMATMGIATALTGLLPSYASVGLVATVA